MKPRVRAKLLTVLIFIFIAGSVIGEHGFHVTWPAQPWIKLAG